MFDFEKLEVYKVVEETNILLYRFFQRSKNLDDHIKDQWKRAGLSILLNLAEGSGRMNIAEKKHYLTIARGSVYESVALLNYLNQLNLIEPETYKQLYGLYEQSSKMLLAMYRSYNKE